MKLYQNWLPLLKEDDQTALVFGALRHLPVDYALGPWLRLTLERDVAARPLEVEDFWPRLDSIVDGATTTEPELVFDVDDGEPLLVVIENKPGVREHALAQIKREAVDAVNATGAKRVALIMVSADVTPPMELSDWRKDVVGALRAYGLRAKVELKHSSWASIGRVLQAVRDPGWKLYIEDVIAQLRFRALLGYEGAPLFEDIDMPLTVPKAVNAYNRTILSVRQFFLALHGQPKFKALKLGGLYRPDGYKMARDGTSGHPEQHATWFENTLVLSAYRRARWPKPLGAFVAFDLTTETDTADICAGAFWAEQNHLIGSFPVVDYEAEIATGLDRDGLELFGYSGAAYGTSWVWATRPWETGAADEDVGWTVKQLTAVVDAFATKRR